MKKREPKESNVGLKPIEIMKKKISEVLKIFFFDY
jgi:hypothetical protein